MGHLVYLFGRRDQFKPPRGYPPVLDKIRIGEDEDGDEFEYHIQVSNNSKLKLNGYYAKMGLYVYPDDQDIDNMNPVTPKFRIEKYTFRVGK